MDLIHSFSSVQNYQLPKDDMPAQHLQDGNWSAPLSCWLQLPPAASTHQAHPPSAAAAAASAAPASAEPSHPFLWFVASRPPYLNETESVVHELERVRADADMALKQKLLADRADEVGTEALRIPAMSMAGIGSASRSVAADATASAPSASASSSSSSSSGPAQSANPIFTSENIVSDTHNLKHYAVDQEDDDAG